MKALSQIIRFSSLALVLILGACSSGVSLGQTTPSPTTPFAQDVPVRTQLPEIEQKTSVPPSTQLISSQARLSAEGVPPEDLLQAASDNTAFATALYQQFRSQDGNLFFSPYSISLALAMTYNGANNETASQMADALHFSLPLERLNPAFNALDMSLRGDQSESEYDFQLEIANSIWPQQGYDFLPEFLDALARYYGSGIFPVDYQANPEAARLQINDWVAEQTAGKIKDLLPPGSIIELTRLVLANAIYFKSAWLQTFDPDQTALADFTLLDGNKVQAPTMHVVSEDLNYFQGEGYQAVELPYRNLSTSMIAVMPDEGNFEAFEGSLSAEAIETIRQGLASSEAQVTLSMPSFKFATTLDLIPPLQSLGMTDAFIPDVADFSKTDGRKILYISGAFHKAYVDVNEKGTEAAAATGVVEQAISAPTEFVTIALDHPFLFMIVDRNSGTVLFLGRVVNPQ
jgi:serpin B